MTELFVNPVPDQPIQKYLNFDFPCGGDLGSVGVEQAPAGPGSGGYCAHVPGGPAAFGNVNLNTPSNEQLYGPLGSPPKDQGHPFMMENPPEPGDPPIGVVTHDRILDIDQDMVICHTARLSGDFVEFLASKPFYSVTTLTAVPSRGGAAEVPLGRFITWLEPQAEDANVWFFRAGTTTYELLNTALVHIGNPSAAGFEAGMQYKLLVEWEFYKWTGSGSAPATPPDPATGRNYRRLEITGFVDDLSFRVNRRTVGP